MPFAPFVASCSYIRDILQPFTEFDGPWEAKVWVVHNGIQCARFDGMLEDPGSVKGTYGIGPLDPVVLFVGRMVGGMKGGDILIEAVPDILQCHADAKVVFVGDGDNKMHCDHRAKELNVEASCRFLGARSGEELVNLLLGCLGTPSHFDLVHSFDS